MFKVFFRKKAQLELLKDLQGILLKKEPLYREQNPVQWFFLFINRNADFSAWKGQALLRASIYRSISSIM